MNQASASITPAAGSWVVAQCQTPKGHTLMQVGFDEIERLRNWVTWQLRPFQLQPGGYALLMTGSSATWPMVAVQRAIQDATLLPTYAETSVFDVYRVAAIVRQFKLSALFNLHAASLAELERTAPDALDHLRLIPAIFATPPAKHRLDELGIRSYAMQNLGPTLAIECPQHGGMHVDGREWQIEAIDGELHATSLLPRLHAFERFNTGFHGQVLSGACGCGNPDVRVQI